MSAAVYIFIITLVLLIVCCKFTTCILLRVVVHHCFSSAVKDLGEYKDMIRSNWLKSVRRPNVEPCGRSYSTSEKDFSPYFSKNTATPIRSERSLSAEVNLCKQAHGLVDWLQRVRYSNLR